MLINTEISLLNFLNIKTKRELASFLNIEYKLLVYNLYRLPDDKKYTEFLIKKRNGDSRNILAPSSNIKYIQHNLNVTLQNLFSQKSCVHGFVKSKSIVTNAKKHINKRILINLDIKDFFSSINFGRVRGLFLSKPFNFDETVATTLAQICCFNGYLPQGAPSSPIISNFICRRLDNCLLKLATENKCTYSRYADDITFSTNLSKIPDCIGRIIDNKLELNTDFIKIFSDNGFEINHKKVRYALKNNRQEVTGLIINKKLNIRRKYYKQVRSMLHAWEKFGVDAAAKEHFEKFNLKHLNVASEVITYKSVLYGKIGYIGSIIGKDNNIYIKLCHRLKTLAPQVKLSIIRKENEIESLPTVYGEGKTDTKHLQAALTKFNAEGLFIDLPIKFKMYDPGTEMSNSELLNTCRVLSNIGTQKNKIICIFDRDDKKFIDKVCDKDGNFKNWGKNVFSLLLPAPPHRTFKEICIEHLYTDIELKTMDKNGRRIYTSDEFDSTSGLHLLEELSYGHSSRLKSKIPFIIDDKVINKEKDNVALPKNDFAEYILKKENGYDNFTFEHFKPIFEELSKIFKS